MSFLSTLPIGLPRALATRTRAAVARTRRGGARHPVEEDIDAWTTSGMRGSSARPLRRQYACELMDGSRRLPMLLTQSGFNYL